MKYIDFILKKRDKEYKLKLSYLYFFQIIEHFSFIEKKENDFYIFFNSIVEQISNEKINFNEEDNLGICYINWEDNLFFVSSDNSFLPFNNFYIPSLFFNIDQARDYSLIKILLKNWKTGNIDNKIECYYKCEKSSIFKDFELNFDFKNEEDLLTFLKNYRKIEKNPVNEFKNFNLSIVDNQVDIKDIEDFSMVKFNVCFKKWNFKNLEYNDNSIKEILKISNINDF